MQDQMSLASFLRDLRTAQNLSLGKLAERAGLSKGTVSEWESGAHRPRLPEINALLGAVAATEAERQRALVLLDAPRGHRRLRAEQPSFARFEKEVGTMPGPGELLRALRQRRGLHLEPLAQALRISPATLSRWERSQVMPSAAQWDDALSLLHASAEERAALRELQRARLPQSAHPTIESALHQLNLLQRVHSIVGQELGCLALEASAWHLASRSESGRQMLGQIYAYHADVLSYQNRYKEAQVYAERSLRLLPSYESASGGNWISAFLASAHALVLAGRRPAPRRGLEMLTQGDTLPLSVRDRAWMYSRVSEYLYLDGATDAALSMAVKATDLAERDGRNTNYHWRQIDLVSILRRTGRSAEAIQIFKIDEVNDLAMRARMLECHVKLLLDLQQRSEAHEAMLTLRKHIEAHNLTDSRTSADALTLRM